MGSSGKLILIVVVLALAGAGAWMWLGAEPSQSPDERAASLRGDSADEAGAAALPGFEAQPRSAEPLVAEGIAPTTTDASAAAAAAGVPTADPASLESHARLVGRVTRRDTGAPVAGLAVVATTIPVATPVVAFTSAVTDADGRYRLAFARAVQLETLRVAAGAETRNLFRRLDVALALGTESEQDLQVDLGATVSGRVVDADGKPVAGARVRGWNESTWSLGVRPSDLPPDQEAVTDASGAFRLGGVGPDFVLAGDAPGQTGIERLTGQLASGAQVEGLTLRLGLARALRGLVLGASDAPVPDAFVEIEPVAADTQQAPTGVPGVFSVRPPAAVGRSDEAGRFELAELAHLPYSVAVTSLDHVPWSGRHAPGDADLVVHLGAGTRLTGEVSSVRGGPVPGAEVTVCSIANGPWPYPLRRALTDAEGRFEVTGLAPDPQAVVLVRGAGHAIHLELHVEIAEDGPNHVALVLAEARALAGIVVDEHDQPVAGRQLSIEGDRSVPVPDGMTLTPLPTWERPFQGLNETTTDDEGRFRFDQLYDGQFELRVAEASGSGTAAQLEARSGSEDLRIVLGGTPPGVTWVGTARDATTGLPIESFTVIPMIPSGQGGMTGNGHDVVDPDGAFRITGLPPGPIQPQAKAVGYADLHLPLRDYSEGEHQLDLLLSAARALSLRVVDDEHEPVGDAKLTFLDPAGETMWIKSGPYSGTTSLETDARGEAVAMGLPAGRVTVRVKTGWFGGGEDFPFDLRHELKGTQVLVLGGGDGTQTVLVFFFGAEQALPADWSMQGLGARDLEQWVASGTVWPIETPIVIKALGADGGALAERRVDPGDAGTAGAAGTAEGGPTPIPGVTGPCNVQLKVPAEPLEFEALAEGYETLRRAWQPDRSSDGDEVVVLLLVRKA